VFPMKSEAFHETNELAAETGRKGGHSSGGNFANDPERATRAGHRGRRSFAR
jgi:uncharacterized protein